MTETLTTSNKVSAAIELKQHPYAMIMMDIRKDASSLGLTACIYHFLGLLVTSCFELFHRLIPGLGLCQSILAISKRCARLLAQLLHIGRCVVHRVVSPHLIDVSYSGATDSTTISVHFFGL